ncbi:MAG TPA: presenilin family intramembrane aspartyl protease [Methanocorpusculum sp.]|nr:presenilin family intramembrane aspartyl protease [Methanocorpusculum sp.]
MSDRTGHSFGADAGLILVMLIVEICAVLMIEPILNAGITAFDNPDTLLNVGLFILLMLVFTAVLLLLIKKNAKKILTAIIAIALAWVIYYLVMALCALVFSGALPHVIGIAAGILAVVLLLIHPEWYLINLVGIVASTGCAVIFGVSLSVLPVIVLLALLMLYDYISVKRSKHMLTLADGVMHQKMPIMFVMPKILSYSYRKTGITISDDTKDKGAYMLGMGDIIFPAILVVSAQVYASFAGILNICGLALPAFGAMLGSVAGLILVLVLVNRGKPQPGLPLINGCAIAGFLLCCLIAGSWGWISAPVF